MGIPRPRRLGLTRCMSRFTCGPQSAPGCVRRPVVVTGWPRWPPRASPTRWGRAGRPTTPSTS
eukprot:568579-Alexandrium_andersonii.AAC.1